MKAGWRRESLDALCVLVTDGTHSSPKTASSGRPYITVRDISNGGIDFENCSFIDEVNYTELCKNGCNPAPGDVLFSKDGTVGKVALVGAGPEFVVLSSLAIVRPDQSKIAPSYLAFAMQSPDFLDAAIGQKTGVAIRRIILKNLKQIQVPFPPLSEQHRIVAILDEAFDGIATAKANAETNLQNARALFESHLQKVFTERGEGWEEKSLGEVCDFENGDRGKNYPNRNEYVDSGIPWINTGHIQPDGTLSENEMNFITEEKFKSLRSGKIQVGDLVYCLRGATLGKTALVEPLTIGAVASSLVILRPKSALDSRFLYHYLNSPIGRESIRTYENGAAQPNLGAKSVAKFRINLPCIAVQKETASKLDDIRSETQRLESLYKQKLAALGDLKKSLLHQAFSGAL